jgi:hypothetical protein
MATIDSPSAMMTIHAHQSAASTSIPRKTPPAVASADIRLVTCVKAKTKTRSKNSSSGVTRGSNSRAPSMHGS